MYPPWNGNIHNFGGNIHPYFWVDTHINLPDVDPGYFGPGYFTLGPAETLVN